MGISEHYSLKVYPKCLCVSYQLCQNQVREGRKYLYFVKSIFALYFLTLSPKMRMSAKKRQVLNFNWVEKTNILPFLIHTHTHTHTQSSLGTVKTVDKIYFSSVITCPKKLIYKKKKKL